MTALAFDDTRYKQRNMTNDRVIELTKIDEEKSIYSGSGLVDNRLLSGGNKLHAIRGENSLWTLKYDRGEIPEALNQSFTTFNKLEWFVSQYYARRNLKIKEIIDA